MQRIFLMLMLWYWVDTFNNMCLLKQRSLCQLINHFSSRSIILEGEEFKRCLFKCKEMDCCNHQIIFCFHCRNFLLLAPTSTKRVLSPKLNFKNALKAVILIFLIWTFGSSQSGQRRDKDNKEIKSSTGFQTDFVWAPATSSSLLLLNLGADNVLFAFRRQTAARPPDFHHNT